jgi:hypothetical protein
MPNPDNIKQHEFKPGESGNPNGRPRKYVSDLKAQGYKLSEVNDAIQALMSMDLEELKEVAQNPKATVLEVTIAMAIKKSIDRGSLYSIETLLTRVYGKPKELTEASGTQKIIVEYVNQNDKPISSSPSPADSD